MHRTRTISAYVATAATADHPEDQVELAALHLLDTLGAVVACRDLEPAVMARRYVSTWAGAPASERRSVTILGTGQHAPLVEAVFAGAMTAHAAEINDFIPSVFVQPGPAIVATALGVGQAVDASGAEVIGAIIAGYELAARVPRAVGVGNLRRAGIANHGVGPCFGAAATASALLRQSPERVADVLSLTAQQASGSWQWLLDVDHMEKAFVFAGLGARNGLQAALLVEAGFRGIPDVADRPGTWFTSPPFSSDDGDGDLDALVDGLGTNSVLPQVAYKRYPVGGPTQPAVEALLDLTDEVTADGVRRVTIDMPGRAQAFRDAEMPALNLRYLTAIILLDRRLDFVGAQSRARMLGDAAVRDLMDRVDVRHDPAQEAGAGAERTESARVTVELDDGRTLERFVPHVLGFPSHPMTRAHVEAKALDLLSGPLGSARARRLVDASREPKAHGAAVLVDLVSG